MVRVLHGAPLASMVVWCPYLRFDDGNSFYQLRLIMGSNEFLGCNCYKEFFFPHYSSNRKRGCYVDMGRIYCGKSYLKQVL